MIFVFNNSTILTATDMAVSLMRVTNLAIRIRPESARNYISQKPPQEKLQGRSEDANQETVIIKQEIFERRKDKCSHLQCLFRDNCLIYDPADSLPTGSNYVSSLPDEVLLYLLKFLIQASFIYA
jgi:hypothetical protein